MMENTFSYAFNLLGRLISFKTDVKLKRYADCAWFIEKEAKSIGLDVEVYDSEILAKDGLSRPNLLVKLDVGSPRTILWVTHYDVVPAGSGWSRNPYSMTVEGEKLYGRGAVDDKGCIAASMAALKELSGEEELEFNIHLLISVDEEVGGKLGVGYMVKEVGIRGDGIIILDSSPEYISVGACGIVWAEITVEGSQGHAAYPFLHRNPIYDCQKLILGIRRYSSMLENIRTNFPAPPGSPKPWVFRRLSVTMIHAGMKENVIPGECKITVDRRITPDEDPDESYNKLEAEVYNIACQYGFKVSEVKPIAKLPGYYTDPESWLVKRFKASADRYFNNPPIAVELAGNDGHFFKDFGVPIICYGLARRNTNYHGIDEYVNLRDLESLISLLIDFSKHGED